MLAAGDAVSLIEPLMQGILEEPPWSTFIARLRQRLGADYASLVFRPTREGTPEGRVVHLFSGRRSPPIVAQLYRDSLYRDDPLPYHAMQEGRVYSLPELLRVGDPDHELFFRQLLAPSGMNLLRMMRIEEAAGVSAWVTVTRRQMDFDAEHDAVIAGIAPYLRTALRTYTELERARTNALVANEAINRMSFGWLTLDADGHILDSDTKGAHMLAMSDIVLKGRDGVLSARSAPVARAIRNAVATLVADPHARPRAIVLSREPWLDMLLVPANIRVGAARPAPALIAYIHADSWSSTNRCEQIGQLFDLIPSEARLALALSRGMLISEAAAELGITEESARTYSKRIYSKLGARGLPDLIRFIHRSVLAIA